MGVIGVVFVILRAIRFRISGRGEPSAHESRFDNTVSVSCVFSCYCESAEMVDQAWRCCNVLIACAHASGRAGVLDGCLCAM
jgi:hypothetical protein